jgi:hypothetical protein
LFGNGFPRVLELLLGSFQCPAGLIASEHFMDKFPVISAAGFEAILDGGGVIADDADVEHGGETLTGDGVENQPNFERKRDNSDEGQFDFTFSIDFTRSFRFSMD